MSQRDASRSPRGLGGDPSATGSDSHQGLSGTYASMWGAVRGVQRDNPPTGNDIVHIDAKLEHFLKRLNEETRRVRLLENKWKPILRCWHSSARNLMSGKGGGPCTVSRCVGIFTTVTTTNPSRFPCMTGVASRSRSHKARPPGTRTPGGSKLMKVCLPLTRGPRVLIRGPQP